jgi:Uma2 family endonuclease
MGLPAKSFVTLEEYLAFERQSECKNEYWNGQIFAMSGGSSAHSLIAGNLADSLRRPLRKKGCLVYGSDMRVRTSASGVYTYPDVSAVCGKPKFATRTEDTLLNPVLLAEVLSPSTERYDRVGKFALYSDIATLREYLLISSDKVCVERSFRRPGGKWQLTQATSLKDSIRLASVPAILKLKDLYKQVNLPRA